VLTVALIVLAFLVVIYVARRRSAPLRSCENMVVTHAKEGSMSTSQGGEATTNDEHAAPPEAWDAIAAGYDRYVAPQEVELANEALRLVNLELGERFLDVAAGTGGLSLPAARLGAEVLATDWSPEMIEQFDARVRDEGLTNAKGRVMDCHALDLADDSFDVTGSQFGVMLVPDQPRALREMVRVTKPGGRVLVIAYGRPEEFEALQVFIGALKAVAPEFPGLPDDPPPLEFQMSDPNVLGQRLNDAGLKDVRVERTAERPAFASGQEMWDWVMYGNPIPGMLVADLTEDQQARLRQVLDTMLRERAGANGRTVLTNAVNIGIGAK
jgi:ubiquinone/menaquinone biosynthesis C-methylase UbiE